MTAAVNAALVGPILGGAGQIKRTIALPQSFRATHQTSGLLGYPAIDVFGPEGSSVGAPDSGQLRDVHFIPWDVNKRVGGWTGYLDTSRGTYFLTHLGSIVNPGPVYQGEPIGTVGVVPDNAWAPHIHEGFHAAFGWSNA